MRFQTQGKSGKRFREARPLFAVSGWIFTFRLRPNFMTRINTPKRSSRWPEAPRRTNCKIRPARPSYSHFWPAPYIAIGGLFSLMAGFGFPERRSARIPASAVGRGIPAGAYTGGVHRSRAVHGQQRRADAGGARPPVRLGQSSAQLDARVAGKFRRGALLHLFSGGSARRAVVGNVAGSGLQYCAGEGIAAVEHGFPAAAWAPTGWYVWPYGSE